VESNWVHSALRPPVAYCASPGWLWCWRNWWNDWLGKPKYSEKTCPSAALSSTKPTCCPDAKTGRRGGKPASNCLSYGTALRICKYQLQAQTSRSKRPYFYGLKTEMSKEWLRRESRVIKFPNSWSKEREDFIVIPKDKRIIFNS
jgi:hypothetical protein